MPSQTTERAFETYVEEILLTRGRRTSASNAEWDKERPLFPAQVLAFIAETQPKPWQDMQACRNALIITAVMERLMCGPLNGSLWT